MPDNEGRIKVNRPDGTFYEMLNPSLYQLPFDFIVWWGKDTEGEFHFELRRYRSGYSIPPHDPNLGICKNLGCFLEVDAPVHDPKYRK